MSSVALPPPPADPEYCVVARGNVSLSRRQRWQVFAALAAISLSLATAFAHMLGSCTLTALGNATEAWLRRGG